jgi:hypothetical protein
MSRHRFIRFESESDFPPEVIEVPASDPRCIEDRLLEAEGYTLDVDASLVQQDVQVFTDAVTALESLEALVQSSLKHGGLDATSARAVEISLEHIAHSLGQHHQTLGVSLESFAVSPVKSSSLALESVQERIATLWRALVKAIQNAVKWLVQLIQRWTSSVTSLEARADALEERLQGLDYWAGRGIIHDDALCRRLTVKGKDSKQVVTEFKHTVSFLMQLTDGVSSSALKALAKIEQLMIAPTITEENVATLKATILSVLQDALTRNFTAGKGYQGVAMSGLPTFESPPLLGGAVLFAVVPNSFDTVTQVMVQKQFVDTPAWKDLPRLSEQDVQLVIKTIHGIRNYQRSVEPFTRLLNDLTKRVEKLSDFTKSAEKATGESAQVLRDAIKTLLKVSTAVPAVVSGTLLSTTGAMLRLAELSVPQS